MLNNLKIMLFGKIIEDAEKDALLELIISGATSRLKRLLGGIEPPKEMNDIILEVAVARYNRIGSEGYASHTVEGESISFADDEFEPYMQEIQDYLDKQQSVKKGKVRFI